MRIVCLSDLHGRLISVPEADVAIIGGDLCPAINHSPEFQAHWLATEFKKWMTTIPVDQVVVVAGNHDWIFQLRPDLVPDLPWYYLQDDYVTINSFKIWGSPWSLPFYNWAFNTEESFLETVYSKIPDDTHIVVNHGPAYGIFDKAPRRNAVGHEHTGSKALLNRLNDLESNDLRVVVTGHIHDDNGIRKIGGTTFVNASILNDRYEYAYPPKIIEVTLP